MDELVRVENKYIGSPATRIFDRINSIINNTKSFSVVHEDRNVTTIDNKNIIDSIYETYRLTPEEEYQSYLFKTKIKSKINELDFI